MNTMKRGPTPKDLIKADDYYDKHTEHVNRLMKETDAAIVPTGSDAMNPILWKGIHWNWFLKHVR